jgi:hypothetical protein
LSESLASIGNTAFYNCLSLTDIYYTGTQTQWNAIENILNAGVPENTQIHYGYVPA